jgi:hypothetical protein
MRSVISLCVAALMAGTISSGAWAGESRSVNFVIFKKADAGYEYDPIMFGSFSRFIKAMHGAQLLLLNHSGSSVNGDVLNLQQDILREQAGDRMSDVGINCQLTFHTMPVGGNIEYSLNGDCQIMESYLTGGRTLHAKIPLTELPDTVQGDDVWIEIYEDSKSGIAFYANVSSR